MEKIYKILIADDSDITHNVINTILSENLNLNYSVISVHNGREACTSAYEEIPDIIIIDIEMPIMSGVEAIKKIKGHPALKKIPIIVISATRQFQAALDAGANDFILKPINELELILRILNNIQLAEKQYEIDTQNELLRSQRKDAINQRDVITKQNKMLTDDLAYARYIQNALLPQRDILNALFSSHFIYNKPKSIVSGDFYWTTRKNDLNIVAVGDCTGHGVAGALMTMAGVAFLNEIISSLEEIHPNAILYILRKRVIELLNQKGEIGELSNGMDMAIIIYDEKEQKLQFSGANNPIYLVRRNGPLEIIKGDRMPIGFYINNNLPYTNHELQISKGDFIYLFSDGYPDQFGGTEGQKFRYNRFQDLIRRAASLPSMDSQRELIEQTMNEWINGYDQIDDMLILGIRI